jgi:hypothetical protein
LRRERLTLLEAGKITSPYKAGKGTSPRSWKDFLSWKLERLPLPKAGKVTSLGSWKDYLSRELERLPLPKAGKITSP